MLTQPARVLAIDGEQVIVETLAKVNCPRCEQGIGCGGGILAKLFGDKTFKLTLSSTEPVQLQQVVQLGISEKLLVRSAFILYGIPLLALVGMALIASLILSEELLVISCALLGFAVGFYVAKGIAARIVTQPNNLPKLMPNETVGCFDGIN
jgi:sigma-E factor negative regulatory protein RseC